MQFPFGVSDNSGTFTAKWFPYAKGGGYRKWYGLITNVVLWENNGRELKSIKDENGRTKSRPQNTEYYFKDGLTYSSISSKLLSIRVIKNTIFGGGGSGIFTNIESELVQGFLNSAVSNYILKQTNSTLNVLVNDILNLPFEIKEDKDRIISLVAENNKLSMNDWNQFEISWEFDKHPLLAKGRLSNIFEKYKSETKLRFDTLKKHEEELNEIFINLYGLQDELTKDVEDENVSISIADKSRDVRSLLSYLIGVLMGRYSIVEDGLIYAGGTFDNTRYGAFDIDKDGVIPIYSDISIEDGLVHRVIGLIKSIYGEEYYRDNVNFIAGALGKKSNETSEETLNRYLNDGFYTDHLKIYKKRPIYWMFSSGKKSGFKALIYMHRYDQNTLAKINAGYFQPATTIIRNQISEIDKSINHAPDNEKVQLERRRLQLVEQLDEATEYGQVLDYMANKYIAIDLDDGVKVNYAKFQNIEITTNNGKVTRDLLVSIK